MDIFMFDRPSARH
ncbi:hypothetical protein BIW11_03521, partial [Tropilaelaps mercedesae]